MKISRILWMCSSPTIKNSQLPSCKNCIHFTPDKSYAEYATTLSKCNKFGEKNIVTDQITYRYADICRSDEDLCGEEGKCFEEDLNIRSKVFWHKAIHRLPYIGLIVLLNMLALRIVIK